MSKTTKSESREPRAESALRLVLLLALVGVLLAYGFDTFRRTRGALTSASDPETYMVVSARPPAQDLAIIDLASRSERVEYLRHDAAFAGALQRGLKIADAEWKAAPLRVFSGPDRKMTRSATTPEALDRAMDAARGEAVGSTSANLAVAAFLGVVAAALVRAGPKLYRATLLALAAASLYQVLAACPTCPVTTILGVPAGLLGFALYGAAFALSLVPRLSTIAPLATAALCGGAAVWQAGMQLAQGTACLPCALISFGNLYVLSSVVLGRSLALPERTPLRLTWAVGGTVALAATAALGTVNALPKGSSERGLTVADVQRKITLVGMPVSELGLTFDPNRRVVMIGAHGCGACDDALAFFRAYPMPALRPVYLASELSKSEERTTRRDLIQATPTFLFLDKSGKVVEDRRGWSKDRDWQRSLVEAIQTFSAGTTPARKEAE